MKSKYEYWSVEKVWDNRAIKTLSINSDQYILVGGENLLMILKLSALVKLEPSYNYEANIEVKDCYYSLCIDDNFYVSCRDRNEVYKLIKICDNKEQSIEQSPGAIKKLFSIEKEIEENTKIIKFHITKDEDRLYLYTLTSQELTKYDLKSKDKKPEKLSTVAKDLLYCHGLYMCTTNREIIGIDTSEKKGNYTELELTDQIVCFDIMLLKSPPVKVIVVSYDSKNNNKNVVELYKKDADSRFSIPKICWSESFSMLITKCILIEEADKIGAILIGNENVLYFYEFRMDNNEMKCEKYLTNLPGLIYSSTIKDSIVAVGLNGCIALSSIDQIRNLYTFQKNSLCNEYSSKAILDYVRTVENNATNKNIKEKAKKFNFTLDISGFANNGMQIFKSNNEYVQCLKILSSILTKQNKDLMDNKIIIMQFAERVIAKYKVLLRSE